MTSIYTLATSVLTKLGTVPHVTTYDTEVPNTPAGAYVVFYPDAGAARSDRLCDTRTRLAWAFTLVCVGRSPQQCRNTVDLVRTALDGWRPTANRADSPVNEVDLNAPMLRDDTVPGDTRYTHTLRYTTVTTRTAT